MYNHTNMLHQATGYNKVMLYLFLCDISECPMQFIKYYDIDGLVQDCSNSIANALELLQSCSKPSI